MGSKNKKLTTQWSIKIVASKLLDRVPVSQTIVGKCAQRRAQEEPRNNLLLQLGNVDKVKFDRLRIAKYNLVDAKRRLDGDES